MDNMDKTLKILITICIVLVAGLGVTMGVLIENNSGMTATQNDSIGNQSVQNNSNSQTHVNATVKNNATEKQPHNGEKLFNGQYYVVINKELIMWVNASQCALFAVL